MEGGTNHDSDLSISAVDSQALAAAARTTGSARRYRALVCALEQVVALPSYRGLGWLGSTVPTESAGVVLLAARRKRQDEGQDGGSCCHPFSALPTAVLERILDMAFRNITDASRTEPERVRFELSVISTMTTNHRQLSGRAHSDGGVEQRLGWQGDVCFFFASTERVMSGSRAAGSARESDSTSFLPAWHFYLPSRLSNLRIEHFASIQDRLGLTKSGDFLAKAIVHTFQQAFPGVFNVRLIRYLSFPDWPVLDSYDKADKEWLERNQPVVCVWRKLLAGVQTLH